MSMFPIESLFILALIGLIAWLVSKSSETPTTTVAASGGVMSDVVNVVNGKKPERAWVMPVVYVALGVLGLLIFYTFLRFALPHLFRGKGIRLPDEDAIKKWIDEEAKRTGKRILLLDEDDFIKEERNGDIDETLIYKLKEGEKAIPHAFFKEKYTRQK